MQRIDLRQILKELYQPSSEEPAVVDVPAMSFLVINWETDPGAEEFSLGVAALHSVAQTVRLMVKQQQSISFRTMPIEILWWEAGQATADSENGKRTVMILQPEYVTAEMVEKAKSAVQEKEELPTSSMRLELVEEGLAVQILRMAASTEEAAAMQQLKQFMVSQNCKPRGRRHEIYLSDLMQSRPEELQVIIRQPVER